MNESVDNISPCHLETTSSGSRLSAQRLITTMTTYSNDSLARITEFHEFVPVNLSTKLAINRGKQPDKEEKFWKKFSAILVLVRANVGRKSGVKGETGRHARVRMSADDARRHTCARVRAMLHTFTERNCRTGYPVMRIATRCYHARQSRDYDGGSAPYSPLLPPFSSQPTRIPLG